MDNPGEATPILGREKNKCFKVLKQRYIFSILGFLGVVHVYAMRVNLSVTLVAMVRSPTQSSPTTTACMELMTPKLQGNTTSSDKIAGEFDWDPNTQSIILGSFFYGYIVTQLPGGILAKRGIAKWLFGIGVLVTSVMTMLTPWAARASFTTFVIVRIVEGLAEGVTYPAMNAMIGHWGPKMERSRMSTFIFSGNSVGTVVAMAFSGLLSSSHFLGGWPSVFYIFGFTGCLWFLFWSFLVFETPSHHPRISQSELQYILDDQDEDELQKKSKKVPWMSIFTSVPVWALAITHFGQNWGFYTLLTEMPTYLSNILHFDIKANGLLSALPYVIHTFCAWIASYVADKFRKSERFTTTTIRKISNSIAFFSPGVCVLAVAFAGCHPVLIMVLLCIAVGLNGCMYSGFNVTHIDMSPEFAGILMGITNCVSNFSGFLSPYVVGQITESGQTLKHWGMVFIISAVVYFVTGLIYNFLCTAEPQNWIKEEQQNTSCEKKNSIASMDSIKKPFAAIDLPLKPL